MYRSPISEYPFYVLIETHGSDEGHDEEKLSRFLEKQMKSGLILDGTVTGEPSKMQVGIALYYQAWAKKNEKLRAVTSGFGALQSLTIGNFNEK